MVADSTTAPAVRPGRVALMIVAASVPMFMVSLNNLVVTNALPEIRDAFDVGQGQLQWVVNAYILAFAGLLLTGAALGDRYGRRRVFVAGITVFALGSVACALAPSALLLVLARVVQGAGAAAVQPLSLTIVAGAAPPHKRSAVIGLWGGVNGLGVALGPMIGGAVTEGIAWQWIFWINVPIAALVVPLVLAVIRESKGADAGLDLVGMVLAGASVTFAVLGIVQSQAGWTHPLVLGPFIVAAVLGVLFVRWERRVAAPLLPLHFYRVRNFVLSNVVSLTMFFGVFGSLFFLTQYLQGPMGFSPFEAGLRTLPWTAMPMVVAPLVGLVVDRIGPGPLMAAGMALQGGGLLWLALIARIDLQYDRVVPAVIMAGVGMGMVFAPNTVGVLGSVRQHEYGKASGANNTIREIGGALGVAVLTTVFRTIFDHVHILSPVDAYRGFVDGMVLAMFVGIAVIAVGALAALCVRRTRMPSAEIPAQREQATVGASAPS